jgi:hypothetical protein
MKYKVLFDNGINFDREEDAEAFAQQIFIWVGILPIVVSVTA